MESLPEKKQPTDTGKTELAVIEPITHDNAAEYQSGLASLEALVGFYMEHHADRNEATTRLHLIDSLLFDCLRWRKTDALAEEEQRTNRKEYTDYTFYAPRRVMILEAKREGDSFEIPAGKVALKYSLKSLSKGNPGLKAAVEQVSGYCQSRGVGIAAICNGHQLIAFIGARDDGHSPIDGDAIVFPSLHFMVQHFVQLWNALSRPGIEDKCLRSRLLGLHQPQLPPSLASRISPYPGVKGRNLFQVDLHLMSELIIEDAAYSEELEETFLRECYCPSGALSQHSLASKAILSARYAALFTKDAPGPTTASVTEKSHLSKDFVADTFSRRPILLLGDVGVGKTTFIRHLIKIDAAELFSKAITIRVDLGSKATLIKSDWKAFVVQEITEQLLNKYEIDIDEDSFVRQVYRSELQRFRRGIFKSLLESDEPAFKDKERGLLEKKLANRPDHLKCAVAHLRKNQNRQVVIFIDNADQRGDATQDDAFLIAQEIAEHWLALVYLPLRPETFHDSTQTGALTGYHPKAFTIEPPRTDRVIMKRLLFALDIINGKITLPQLPGTLAARLPELGAVIRSFMGSMKQNPELPECIDNIAGGNIRLALELVMRFFGSGHVDTENIVKKYNSPEGWTISLHEFLRATIFRDAVHYDRASSPVANLFDVCAVDPREHFLLALILGLLRQAMHSHESHGFCEIPDVYRTFQGVGLTADQIDYAIVRAYRKHLIETPAARSPDDRESPPRTLRVTTVGLYHVDRLASLFTYIDAVLVATPIFDGDVLANLIDDDRIEMRIARAVSFQKYLDAQWSKAGISGTAFDWIQSSTELSADIAAVVAASQRRAVKNRL
jgi:hypothetical protein